MHSAQFSIQEIKNIIRRRKLFFIIPIILVTTLSVVGAFLLPNKYESSTTILAQREQIVNPILGYDIAAAMASEDQLRTYNEIIFSRTNLLKLADSLGLLTSLSTERERQATVNTISKNIETEARGSDAYIIKYTDQEPIKTQRAVHLLSKLFIEMLTNLESQRSEQAVQFLEKKLEETRAKYEASQREVVSFIGSKINNMPSENQSQFAIIESLNGQISDIDAKIKSYQSFLQTLQTISSSLRNDKNKEALYDIARSDIPYAEELNGLLTKYDDYLRRYTSQYPEVQHIEQQVPDLIVKMRGGIESEINKKQSQRWDLDNRKSRLLDEVRVSSINQRMSDDKESDYSIYRKLYDETKVKLEQAKTSRELGMKTSNQFVIIDPPIVPSQPSKPNRTQIVLGGFGLSIFLGFLAMIAREILDTTIRTRRDIEVYRKPVIAYISEGNDDWEN